MSGEMHLETLLATMRPRLHPEVYVFATTTEAYEDDALAPLLVFQESEGTTLIVTRAAAQSAGLAHAFPCRRITLEVHSALEAVGFIAAVAAKLAEAGIGANPVAGFYHDHLFVPEERAEDALAALRDLARESAS